MLIRFVFLSIVIYNAIGNEITTIRHICIYILQEVQIYTCTCTMKRV